MIIEIILLIVGFLCLIKGADYFVEGAASTARNFKVSKMVIGLTIVAFGTSAPELAVSFQALASGNADMVLGNVIGSNITNILLIIGVATLITKITIKSNTIKKELPICLLITLGLTTLLLDIQLSGNIINVLSRSDGIMLVLLFMIFLYYIISLIKNKNQEDCEDYKEHKLHISLLMLAFGLVGIIIGSNLVVENASLIAKALGISERVISLTIVAFGTSLPELVTSIVSAKKHEQDILVGNVIGSNIFNLCIVLGLPIVVYGTLIPSVVSMIDITFLILSTIMLLMFSKRKGIISKLEGIVMLITFTIYYFLVFVI